jgi:hypothetical protein
LDVTPTLIDRVPLPIVTFDIITPVTANANSVDIVKSKLPFPVIAPVEYEVIGAENRICALAWVTPPPCTLTDCGTDTLNDEPTALELTPNAALCEPTAVELTPLIDVAEIVLDGSVIFLLKNSPVVVLLLVYSL